MKIKRFKTKREKMERRRLRVRSKISGTVVKPRLSVFKSNKHIFVQLIDDVEGKTLASASDSEVKIKKTDSPFPRVEKAMEVGKLIAEKALAKKVKEVVYDRGSYRYTGHIKAVAEGARAGGLQF